MLKEIEKTVKETRRFCDICETEMTRHCIKIDLEHNTAQVDYPKIWSKTFDICTICMLEKVFPLIEKEFNIKPTHIREDEKEIQYIEVDGKIAREKDQNKKPEDVPHKKKVLRLALWICDKCGKQLPSYQDKLIIEHLEDHILTETNYKIKILYGEIVTVNEHTQEGQKLLKEIEAELNNLNKELLRVQSNVDQG